MVCVGISLGFQYCTCTVVSWIPYLIPILTGLCIVCLFVCLLLEAASVNRSTHVRFDSDEGESDQQSPETNNQEAAASELSPRAWYPLGTDRALAHTSAPTASLGAKIQTTQHRGAVQPCVTQQQGAVEDGRAPTLLSPGQQQQENSQSQTAVRRHLSFAPFQLLTLRSSAIRQRMYWWIDTRAPWG